MVIEAVGVAVGIPRMQVGISGGIVRISTKNIVVSSIPLRAREGLLSLFVICYRFLILGGRIIANQNLTYILAKQLEREI